MIKCLPDNRKNKKNGIPLVSTDVEEVDCCDTESVLKKNISRAY